MRTELRNRIYDFAAEKSLEELRDEFKVPDGWKWSWHYDYVWKAGREHREFTGLTTVCRQIRAEFLLMYNKRTTFAVRLEDLNRYIDIFVKTPGVADEDVVGSLVVSGERFDSTPINLESLMRLANKARELSIRWYTTTFEPIDLSPIFDAMTHLDDHPVLREYVSASITKIEAQNVRRSGLKIILSVKDASWESWMEYTMYGFDEEGYYTGRDNYPKEYEVLPSEWLDTPELLEALEGWANAVQLWIPEPKALFCVRFIPA